MKGANDLTFTCLKYFKTESQSLKVTLVFFFLILKITLFPGELLELFATKNLVSLENYF